MKKTKDKKIKLIVSVTLLSAMISACKSEEIPAVMTETHAETTVIKVTEHETETETKIETERILDINEVYRNRSLYPEELLEKLTENEELLEFVIDYPEKKNTACAETLEEEIIKGQIPALIQWDERWGYGMYGDSLMASNGCGPTCIAMVAVGLTGRNDITPLKVAKYSEENGYLTASADTSWLLMSIGCNAFGIDGKLLELSEEAMIQSVKDGSPIICSVRAGDFTNGGHFIVLTDFIDGEFIVHDPNSKVRSGQSWSYEELRGQIKNLWNYRILQ